MAKDMLDGFDHTQHKEEVEQRWGKEALNNDWIARSSGGDVRAYVLGLAEMYVADERFPANYGGLDGAAFVRDTLGVHAEREL